MKKNKIFHIKWWLFFLIFFPTVIFIAIEFFFSISQNAFSSNKGAARLDVPFISIVKRNLVIETHLNEAFSDELLKTLNTGKQVIIIFNLELYRSRFSIIPDDCVWTGIVKHSVSYNTATRKYTVSVVLNSKNITKYTEKPAEMLKWVDTFHYLLPVIIDKRNKKKEHYLRMWAKTDMTPLPGSFRTKTILSKKFIPVKLNVLIPESSQKNLDTRIKEQR